MSGALRRASRTFIPHRPPLPRRPCRRVHPPHLRRPHHHQTYVEADQPPLARRSNAPWPEVAAGGYDESVRIRQGEDVEHSGEGRGADIAGREVGVSEYAAQGEFVSAAVERQRFGQSQAARRSAPAVPQVSVDVRPEDRSVFRERFECHVSSVAEAERP